MHSDIWQGWHGIKRVIGLRPRYRLQYQLHLHSLSPQCGMRFSYLYEAAQENSKTDHEPTAKKIHQVPFPYSFFSVATPIQECEIQKPLYHPQHSQWKIWNQDSETGNIGRSIAAMTAQAMTQANPDKMSEGSNQTSCTSSTPWRIISKPLHPSVEGRSPGGQTCGKANSNTN